MSLAAGEQRQGNNTARISNAFAEGATANFRKQLAVRVVQVEVLL